ncbi:amidohydrolase family protein [Sphingomonas colocasiae]|uniref:Amidohydrolase family protein n=1 Tax=Sphingomonas colocasiae TaxID=1848973 RepID=A0ABS7PXU8_9SPHN|nr:amidohydrolase family protein [Sphingomonas colocasiae]MBY8826181.1 amidohydrolase family protein [Sphingomonas colocasiae]
MHILLAPLAAAALSALPVAAQDRGPDAPPINDRGAYLPSSVPTSDDVLRILVPADYNVPKGSFVLVGGRLFDGTGTAARPATIVVQGKRITAILKPGEQAWPADAVVYDVTGKTVMPGLIDLHTHLTYVDRFDAGYGEAVASGADSALRGIRRMGIFLQSGVTSVRDVASHGDTPFVLKRWQADGRIVGPRVFAAGQLITATGGHGAALNKTAPSPMDAVREASGPDGWREAVRIQFKQGADLIKLASEYSQAEIDAAVDEAHSLGLPVTVDSETRYIDMAVKAGVDSIEHPLPRSDAAIALMAKRGIASVPTLIPYRIIQRSSGGYFGSTSRRFELNETTILEMLRKMRKAGIKLGVGTDLITNWIDYMPNAYIEELKGFVKVGYSNSEALVAATKTNAEILRMADRLGTIEPGKLADIIVIDGNPDQDLDALARVTTAFVNGRLMLRDGRLFMAQHMPVPLPQPAR